MRSRDGNHSFSRRLCAIILFSSLALNASEFLVSYRYMVKDAILYNESLFVSKSMRKCHGTPHDGLILESDGGNNLKKIISNNSDEFISYVHKLGLDLNHKETNVNYQNSSTTILTLKTTCFKVDFNDNFARISPLK
jgi:hypothetical protein